MYDFERWDMLGIAAFYIGEFATGKSAIERALQVPGLNDEQRSRLQKNLGFYKEKTVQEQAKQLFTPIQVQEKSGEAPTTENRRARRNRNRRKLNQGRR